MPTVGISLPSYVIEELERVMGKSASEAVKEMVLKFFEKRQFSRKYLEIYKMALQELRMAIDIGKREALKDPKVIALVVAKLASFVRSSIALLRQVTYNEKWSAMGVSTLLWIVDYLEKEALVSQDPCLGSMAFGGLFTLAMTMVLLVPLLIPLSEEEYSALVEDLKKLFTKFQGEKG